jgi:hypothetical protein
MNCGDWVESCTALAEHPDGTFEIIRWADRSQTLPPLPDEEDEPAPVRERAGIAA